jgi:hypothetical protein
MAENKTKPTAQTVEGFVAQVEPEARRAESRAICDLLARASGETPTMWGTSIVGFGSYRYRYDSGREGDAPRVGFSPRKAALTLYVMDGFEGRDELVARVGKVTTGASCVYIKKLSDVDLGALETLVSASLEHMAAKYPA